MGLLPQRGNTPSGSVAPSCLPSPPSNRCGSPSKNTMNAVHPLSTENASKCYFGHVLLMASLICHPKFFSFLLVTFQNSIFSEIFKEKSTLKRIAHKAFVHN